MMVRITSFKGLLLVCVCSILLFLSSPTVTAQPSLDELHKKLQAQYKAIEDDIATPPSRLQHGDSYNSFLRTWQDRLASRFSAAADTVEQILQLDNANGDMWRERLDTLRLYAQPISSPSERTIYGDTEVQKRAQVIDAPEALYTEAARSQQIEGQVRIRLVLAADGTVRNVFPIKSARYGLTEAAVEAARQIKFEPAIRGGQPASQFATFVYDFKKVNAKPYIPRTVF